MQDATVLPDDLDVCHALLAEQATAIVDLQSSREKLTQENQELQLTIQKLLARLSGHRRERYDDPAQMKLGFGDDPAVQDGLADAATQAQEVIQQYTVTRKTKPKQPRNEQLPAHLPRYEVEAEVLPAKKSAPSTVPARSSAMTGPRRWSSNGPS